MLITQVDFYKVLTLHQAKYSTLIFFIFNPHNHTVQKSILRSLFHRGGNKDLEKLCNLPELIQLMRNRVRIQTQVCPVPKPILSALLCDHCAVQPST